MLEATKTEAENGCDGRTIVAGEVKALNKKIAGNVQSNVKVVLSIAFADHDWDRSVTDSKWKRIENSFDFKRFF